jgi:hypothetical protein
MDRHQDFSSISASEFQHRSNANEIGKLLRQSQAFNEQNRSAMAQRHQMPCITFVYGNPHPRQAHGIKL